MYKGKKILAIVPARKNSKGLKDKNLRKINSKNLFLFPILAAKRSKLIDLVLFSTDSKKMFKIAKKYCAYVPFLRPKKFSLDKSSSFSVVRHALDYLNKKEKFFFDYVVLLEPTSPLTETKDIDNALKKLLNSKFKSIVSICKLEKFSSKNLYKLNKKKQLRSIFSNKNPPTRRQDMKDEYILDGSLYISEIKEFFKNKSFVGSKTSGYVINDFLKNIEIDNYNDLSILKKLKFNEI